MYLLTIDDGSHAATISEHADRDTAKRSLCDYVDTTNCVLSSIQTGRAFLSWDLVSLESHRRVAAATIEPSSAQPEVLPRPETTNPAAGSSAHARNCQHPRHSGARTATVWPWQ